MTISSYKRRAELAEHPITKKLFTIAEDKESNLVAAADLKKAEELLAFAEEVGPEICMLKTHIDILDDFTPSVTRELRALADRFHFLIFEDRKFADIGNTVVAQYGGGIYTISEWADIINAHIVPGPGIIEGLKRVGLPKGRALLLLAEMSSQGSLATGEYTKKALAFGEQHRDFVIGFIALQRLSEDPHFIHFTPGIQLESGQDDLGQRYRTPEEAITSGTDFIIVGRGIYGAADPKQAAELHRKRGWAAYDQHRSP
jgi:uridine monophosphate synthetase